MSGGLEEEFWGVKVGDGVFDDGVEIGEVAWDGDGVGGLEGTSNAEALAAEDIEDVGGCGCRIRGYPDGLNGCWVGRGVQGGVNGEREVGKSGMSEASGVG